MAWCPKCKCEYVEGITKCIDCGCELVEQLEEATNQNAWDEEVTIRAMSMMNEANLQEIDNQEEETSGFDLELEEPEEEKQVFYGRYINHEEQAEENRSSAFVLLLVGGLGFVFIVLFFFDLLPVRMAGVSKYMVSGVMGALFLLFLIMGVVSLRNSKILERKAKKENNLTEQIKKWCMDNLSKDTIDSALSFEQGATEEIKYFERFERMKKMVKKQFMNLDEAYLDRMMDEIYPDIFEDEQS